MMLMMMLLLDDSFAAVVGFVVGESATRESIVDRGGWREGGGGEARG